MKTSDEYKTEYGSVTVEDVTKWLKNRIDTRGKEGNLEDDELAGKAAELVNKKEIGQVMEGILPVLLVTKLIGASPTKITLAIGIMLGFQIGYEYRDNKTTSSSTD